MIRQKQHLRTQRRRRRGLSSMLAMLYLVLFGALALGFYAQVNTSVQIAKNEQQVIKALLAAESGVQFMRYHLASVQMPASTQPPQMLQELYNDLSAQLDGSPNMAGKKVGFDGSTIRIPSDPNAFIAATPLNKGNLGFNVTITALSGNIMCTVSGRAGMSVTTTAQRGVRLEFRRESFPPSLFNYALASRGRIVMQSGSVTGLAGFSNDSIATIFSAKTTNPAVSMSGGMIGGEIHATARNLVNVTGGNVAGSTNPTEIMTKYVKVVDAPEFPEIDTTVFIPYAKNPYVAGSTVLKNVRIPANTNPHITGGRIEGILYVEAPNRLDFRGNTVLAGFIVIENKGTSNQNVIDMRGSFTQQLLPPGPEFDVMRDTKGIAILAPTTSLVISGAVDSVLKDNIILGKFTNSGSADWTVEAGTMITLDTTDSATFSGKSVRFKSTGKLNPPTKGLKYSEHFVPVVTTYQELTN
jgi:hypothetical protein